MPKHSPSVSTAKSVLVLVIVAAVTIQPVAGMYQPTPIASPGEPGQQRNDISSQSTDTTFIVDKSDSSAYDSIQNAVSNASDGYVIEVTSGVYNETVRINKSVTVTATEGGNPVLSSNDTRTTAIEIENTSNVVLSNLRVDNYSTGIVLSGSLDTIRIRSMAISHVGTGVQISPAGTAVIRNLTIADNSITTVSGTSIDLLPRDQSVINATGIVGNQLQEAGNFGVDVTARNNATIADLRILRNQIGKTGNRGLRIEAGRRETHVDPAPRDSLIENLSVGNNELVDTGGIQVESPDPVNFSGRISIFSNKLTDSGIVLHSHSDTKSRAVVISNNTIQNSGRDGIDLFTSGTRLRIRVVGNQIEETGAHGLDIDPNGDVLRLTISDNSVHSTALNSLDVSLDVNRFPVLNITGNTFVQTDRDYDAVTLSADGGIGSSVNISHNRIREPGGRGIDTWLQNGVDIDAFVFRNNTVIDSDGTGIDAELEGTGNVSVVIADNAVISTRSDQRARNGLSVQVDAENASVRVENNSVDSTSNHGVVIDTGYDMQRLTFAVSDNDVNASQGHGIRVKPDSDIARANLTENAVRRAKHGLSFDTRSDVRGLFVANNSVINSSNDGIDLGSDDIKRVRVADNFVRGAGGEGLTFDADTVNVGAITDNRIIGSSKTGLEVGFGGARSSGGVDEFGIERNRIRNGSGPGLSVDGSGIRISENRVTNTSGGLQVRSGADNTLRSNYLANNGVGLQLRGAVTNTLYNNTLVDNEFNLEIIGFRRRNYDHRIPANNTINGDPIYYRLDAADVTIGPGTDAGFIGVIGGENITIRDQDLSNNGQGLLLFNVSHVEIANSSFSRNTRGIWIQQSKDISISNTSVSRNRIGVSGRASSDLQLRYINASENTGSGFAFGLYFDSAKNVSIANVTIQRNNNTGSDFGGGISVFSSRNVSVRNAIISNNSGHDAFGIWLYSVDEFKLRETIATHTVGRSNGGVGVMLTQSSGTISALSTRSNNLGLFTMPNGNLSITDSHFVENEQGIVIEAGWGTSLSSNEKVTIERSAISQNTEDGLSIAAGIPVEHLEIEENVFQRNGGVALRSNNTTTALDATHNYWGTADGPSGDFNGSGDRVVGNVTVRPFYTDANLTSLSSTEPPARLVVNKSEEAAYDAIQNAVDNASDGDTIVVEPGIYREQLTVTKDIEMVAPDGAVLNGSTLGGPVGAVGYVDEFNFSAPVWNQSNVTIAVRIAGSASPTLDGFTITHYTVGLSATDTGGSWTVRNASLTHLTAVGIEAIGSTGDWEVHRTTIASIGDGNTSTNNPGIDARGAAGDWRLANVTIRAIDGGQTPAESVTDGIEALGSTGAWTVQNTTITNVSDIGIDASHTEASWLVGDSRITAVNRIGIGVVESTGRWEIEATVIENVSGDGAGVLLINPNERWRLDNVTVRRAPNGVQMIGSAPNWTIRDSRLTRTRGTGIIVDDADGPWTVRNTDLINNSHGGLLIAPGSELYGAVVHDSRFADNRIYGLRNEESGRVNATFNWWGASDGPGGVFNGSGAAVIGNVSVRPFYSGRDQTETATEVHRTGFVVNKTDPDAFDSIQAAVRAATPGTTVVVHPGVYNETVEIDTPITLVGSPNPGSIGAGADAPVLDGDRARDTAIRLLDAADNTTIKGMVITNYTRAGVTTAGELQDVTIRDTTIRHIDGSFFPVGIATYQLDVVHERLLIKRNKIVHPGGDGIVLFGARNATVADNVIVGGTHVGTEPFGPGTAGGIIVAPYSNQTDITTSDILIEDNVIKGTITSAALGVFPVNFSGQSHARAEDIEFRDNLVTADDVKRGIVIHPQTQKSSVSNVLIIHNELYATEQGVVIDARPGSISGIRIFENIIQNSSTNGIKVHSGPGEEIEIHETNIIQNAGAGLNHSGTGQVNATRNYWGASDGPSGDFGGSGAPVVGNVSISPFFIDENQTTLSSGVGQPSGGGAQNEAGIAPFGETDPLTGQTEPANLGGVMQAETPFAANVTVTLVRSSATNYSLNIFAPSTATNVTFYLQVQAISSAQDIDNLVMFLDGDAHDYIVNETAGPGNSPWVAFNIPSFSTRTVTFKSSNLSVTDVTLNRSTIQTGQSVNISATVENSGSQQESGNVSLLVNDEIVENRSITVAAGSTNTTSFIHNFATEGEFEIVVNDFAAAENVTVDNTPPTVSNLTINDRDGNGEVEDGHIVNVSVDAADDAAGVQQVVVNASTFGAGTATLVDDGTGTFVGNFTVDIENATTGSQSVRVVVTDAAGNSATATSETLEVVESTTVDEGQPGFGMTAALVALLLVVGFGLRRRNG